jgi:UPF0271 protein
MNEGLLDLNSDLGEGERLARTHALMKVITSANIACGGHAGSLPTMEKCILLAKRYGVRVGAHPGPCDKTNFGRAPLSIKPDELELLLLQQVGALERLAGAHKAALHHIKLHGGLYHAVEVDGQLAKAYVNAVKRWWPGALIYARARGKVAPTAKKAGVICWQEAFVDRNYRSDGSLVPRDSSDALLKNRKAVSCRLRDIVSYRAVRTIDRKRLILNPQTICVHADTPNAVTFAALAREAVRG